MKIALLCKSDTTGGAAVVTFRLMEALRRLGHDARMVVAEKRSDSPRVIPAAPRWRAMMPFIIERLRIFQANGHDRSTLFKIDTGSDGLPVHCIPFVREADAICLNWVNQGFVSLSEVERLCSLGKPVIWTMHDMWNLTGICHHAGDCPRYLSPGRCGDCPLMGDKAGEGDLSRLTWQKKCKLYCHNQIHFVAVSNWLAGRAKASTLLEDAKLSVIPNSFPIDDENIGMHPGASAQNGNIFADGNKIRIIFGAARIDDPVKGHPTLVRATQLLCERFPEAAARMELVTYGSLKDPDALKGVALPHTHLGSIPPAEIRRVYESASIVVSTSEWETLPGTLVEGQAWGCVPVALDHGGQSDIIDHLRTGWLAPWDNDREKNALSIAEGIVWAAEHRDGILDDMRRSVIEKFSEDSVARRYISLIERLALR